MRNPSLALRAMRARVDVDPRRGRVGDAAAAHALLALLGFPVDDAATERSTVVGKHGAELFDRP
jgi:hypothetical protein